MSSLAVLVLEMIAVYFLAIVVIAHTYHRKIRNLTDFFLAGRTLGEWPVAISIIASWFGASSTIGSINLLHQEGVSALWKMIIPAIISCVCITFFFSSRVRGLKTLSQPHEIEKHYGRPARFLLAWIILASVTALVASELVAAGQFLQMILGIDVFSATVGMSIAVLAYSFLGGYFAVVVTDYALFGMFGLAIMILFGFACLHSFMHPVLVLKLWAHPPQQDFWNFGKDLFKNLCLLAAFIPAWTIAPEAWQRMSSCCHQKLSIRAGILATVCLGMLYGMVAATGILSAGISPGLHAVVLVDLAKQLPSSILTVIVLVGVIAAISSVMDSSLNVGSLTLTHDLYGGFFRPQAGQKELLLVSRAAMLLIVCPAIYIALSDGNILHVLWISADIYATTMFFPVLGMLYFPSAGRWSGFLAICGGGLAMLLGFLQHNPFCPYFWPAWPYATLVGFLMSGFGFLTGALCPFFLSWREKSPAIAP